MKNIGHLVSWSAESPNIAPEFRNDGVREPGRMRCVARTSSLRTCSMLRDEREENHRSVRWFRIPLTSSQEKKHRPQLSVSFRGSRIRVETDEYG